VGFKSVGFKSMACIAAIALLATVQNVQADSGVDQLVKLFGILEDQCFKTFGASVREARRPVVCACIAGGSTLLSGMTGENGKILMDQKDEWMKFVKPVVEMCTAKYK
jgi:hypothetical protein